MIQQTRPYEGSIRFFLFCGGLLLAATLYTAYSQLYLLPPRLATDLGQISPTLLQIYQWFWDHARSLGKWGVREGLFDPEVREFGKNGIPAYFINLIGGLTAAVLAVFIGLIAFLGRSRTQVAETSVIPSPMQPSLNPPANEPSSASPSALHWASDKAGHDGQNGQSSAKDWRFGLTEPPIPKKTLSPQERKIIADTKAQTHPPSPWQHAGSLSSMQKALDESYHCINEAESALQRLQRSALNLALTHPSLEAGDDVTEIHLAMASLDRLLRTIKSSQAEISEQLAQLNADPYPSRGTRAS